MEVYFDNSATTKPYEEVIEAVAAGMRDYYGNPSSAHGLGVKAEGKINECREILSKTIGASKEEIIFTSGGSEGNNFLIKGFVSAGGHIITSRIEHPSVKNTFEELAEFGVRVTFLKVDNKGKILLEELEEAINKDTQLVSIMHVNNEMGAIQDIEAIGKIIKSKSSRAKFHVDAVQSYCKMPIDVKRCNIDLLSTSAHKIHGPRGVGMTYVRKGLNPKPLISGGGQEKNMRSGTENLAAICGFATAAEIMHRNMARNYETVKDLKEYFIDKTKHIPKIRINSPSEDDFSPYILSISFIGVRGEVMLHSLESDQIYVSTGSACSSKNTKDSHVLSALGLCKEEISGTIRFSFNEDNTKEEVDYTVDKINKALVFLRRVKR